MPCTTALANVVANPRVYFLGPLSFMIPFLHIGWLTIPTFGLMVATAIFVAGFIIQAELIAAA